MSDETLITEEISEGKEILDEYWSMWTYGDIAEDINNYSKYENISSATDQGKYVEPKLSKIRFFEMRQIDNIRDLHKRNCEHHILKMDYNCFLNDNINNMFNISSDHGIYFFIHALII